MAGYLVTFYDFDSLVDCIQSGVYSAWINPMNRQGSTFWTASGMGGFADYASMQAGDDIYFFSKRNIYGIGRIVNVGDDCKYLNYPGSIYPDTQDYNSFRETILVDYGVRSASNRVVCFFQPEPFIFRDGVDMDDLLKSSPGRFKVVPFWSGATFVRVGDEENQAFKDIILKQNVDWLENPRNDQIFLSNHHNVHEQIAERVFDHPEYAFDFSPLLDRMANGKGKLGLESLIEATLVHQIANQEVGTVEQLGNWDYVSRQVPASPPKSPEYIDRMDIFGLSYIPNHRPTVSNYFVAELKADWVTLEDLLQLMKYVDWIRDEYASGDYGMIKAFLIGFRFRPGLLEQWSDFAERQFTSGSHGKVSNRRWDDVSLLEYKYDSEASRIVLRPALPVPDANDFRLG